MPGDMMIVGFEFTGADLLRAVNLGLNRLDGVRMFHESTDQEGQLYGIEHVYRLSEAAWIEYRQIDRWQVVLAPLGTGDDADPSWRMLEPRSAAWIGRAARRWLEDDTIRVPFVVLDNVSPIGDGVADNPPTRRRAGEIFVKMTGATTGRIEAPAVMQKAVDAILQGITAANVSWETSTGDDQAGAPAWANQDWYLTLSIEWRERYDRLRPYKEDWEAWKVTDAELAKLFGKTSGTVATWRRELKKQKAPDMDWHKQQGSARGSA